MNSFHFQSFLFAFVLFGAVFITRPAISPEEAELPAREIQARTSVTLVPTAIEEITSPPIPRAGAEPVPPKVLLEPEARVRGVPVLTVNAAILKNMSSGKIFLEKKAYDRWPIASLVKLMTAVLAAEEIPLDKKITITESAVAMEGAVGNFAPGEVFTAHDLIRATLVGSSNDAAEALREAYGSQEFVSAMQRKAASLGMEHTTFFDPTGLSYLNQSTASDLEILARYIVDTHPELFEITHASEVAIRELQTGRSRAIRSTHPFITNPEFIGGKTGFTPEARGNLISLFRHEEQTFLVIVLGSNDRFRETKILYDFITRR